MQSKPAGVETLTQRQKEILRLVSQQFQSKEIARLLNIGERTVKTHTEEARRRLGVATSRDAARLLAAHEAAAIGRDDRGAQRPMGSDAANDVSLPHEQTLHAQSLASARSLGPSRNGLARDGGAGEAVLDPGNSGRYPDTDPNPRTGDSLVQSDRGDRLVDRRWDSPGRSPDLAYRSDLEKRLAKLNAFQWLGLIVIVGVLSAVLVSGLIAACLGTLEGLQVLNRQIR
jgi:DNA-binding CsgD family transcriptional regulator